MSLCQTMLRKATLPPNAVVMCISAKPANLPADPRSGIWPPEYREALRANPEQRFVVGVMRITRVVSAAAYHFHGEGAGRGSRIYSKIDAKSVAKARRVKCPDGSLARLLTKAKYHNKQPLSDTTDVRSDLRGNVLLSAGPFVRFPSSLEGALGVTRDVASWLKQKKFNRGFRVARQGVRKDSCVFDLARAVWAGSARKQ